ncbi:MAG: bifunctional adenosylcobinamide kinase/adenosylcobinamide-phosphate guanylyltransferase [Oscillospiraceae bacterium]|nr:bifunctional adenosylcobinamide kinase/adenosylcobinamide-phosphate guanylyltransferase [Oscillospiraceae bacterium]
MMTLITGGAKCGKSHLAERLLDDFTDNKYYIATMEPFGEEASAAIARHRRIRAGKGFETKEKYTSLHELELPGKSHILLECIANLCANEMFGGSEICDPTDSIMRGTEHLKSRAETLVIVTNNVGSDGIDYSKETNRYIEVMGRVNRLIADISDNVIECVYGFPVILKGKL